MRQLRDALPLPCPYRHFLFDHDAKFGNDVAAFLKASGIEPLRTSVRRPWQNGTAERWVDSARRENSTFRLQPTAFIFVDCMVITLSRRVHFLRATELTQEPVLMTDSRKPRHRGGSHG